jgi:hypothetical protein
MANPHATTFTAGGVSSLTWSGTSALSATISCQVLGPHEFTETRTYKFAQRSV